MAQEWTIKEALDWTVGYLERKGDENPRLSAEWLLSAACQLSRIQLYVNYERLLSEGEREVLRGFVTRRGTGEPLQYITGEAPFRHVTLKVRSGVLIPRPETEVLVSEALALLPAADKRVAFDSTIEAWEGDLLKAAQEAQEGADDVQDSSAASSAAAAEAEARLEQRFDAPIGARPEEDTPEGLPASATAASGSSAADTAPKRPMPYLVADICTGSGCIAVSLATERPDVRVFATDIDDKAVALARENAEACGVADRVKVAQCNLGEALPPSALGRLDLVVSNPPYVPSAVVAGLPEEVRGFEPALALDGGPDGLSLFRLIAPWAMQALKPGGGLVCELFEEHMEEARAFALSCGFADARIVCDLAGRPRVLVALRASEDAEEGAAQ